MLLWEPVAGCRAAGLAGPAAAVAATFAAVAAGPLLQLQMAAYALHLCQSQAVFAAAFEAHAALLPGTGQGLAWEYQAAPAALAEGHAVLLLPHRCFLACLHTAVGIQVLHAIMRFQAAHCVLVLPRKCLLECIL